jgi:hypothetical protein
MKSFNLKSIFVLILLTFTIVFFYSENSKDQSTSDHALLLEEYPNEWMYNQRAYPNNYINRNAMQEAISTSKAILTNRTPQQGSDWNLIGPLNTGGRITDLAISPDNDGHLYVAAAVGGIFKSIDRGVNWTPVFDEVAKPSIGNIAIAPSNSQRIYVGTGEANGSATEGAYFGMAFIEVMMAETTGYT